MNRRRFLTALASGLVAVSVDPERLIWTPGAKTHIFPPPTGWRADADGNISVRFTSISLDEQWSEEYKYAPFLPGLIEQVAKDLAARIDADIIRIFGTVGTFPIVLDRTMPRDAVDLVTTRDRVRLTGVLS